MPWPDPKTPSGKALFSPLPPETILDDVLTPLNIVARGYRMVYDGQAAAYDRVSKNVQQEWRRKVRTLVGNWQLLRLKPALLSPAANPVLFRFLSHKIIRLLNLRYFFCVLNAATAVAFIKFATDRTGKLWARPAPDAR
jgi:hypothetical protein